MAKNIRVLTITSQKNEEMRQKRRYTYPVSPVAGIVTISLTIEVIHVESNVQDPVDCGCCDNG